MAVTWHPVFPVAVAGPVLTGADVHAWHDFFDDDVVAHDQGFVMDVVAGKGWEDGVRDEVDGDSGGGEGQKGNETDLC